MRKNIKDTLTFVLVSATITATTLVAEAAAPVTAMAHDCGHYYNCNYDHSSFTAYVNNSAGVNLRTSTCTSSTMICNLKNGTAVQVIGTGYKGDGYDWYKITVNGYTGYVTSHLLTTSGCYNRNTCTCSNTYTVTGTTHYLAVRTAAEYDHNNIIAKLYNGDTFTVTSSGVNGYVYGHTSNGVYGYVNAKYLK